MLHPAIRISFDELYAGLNKNVQEKNIIKVQKDDLELYNYSQQCAYNREWNYYTLLARGLIICPSQNRVVATPFPKFFNYGEFTTELPDLPFEVSEKYDGSLGIIYYHSGWRVSTKGSFDSEQAKWAEDYLRENISTQNLDVDSTYLVEIIYKQNKIVVNYNFEGLVLLAVFKEGVELDRELVNFRILVSS